MRNTIPEDQGIETNTMIAYLIFFIVQFPFLCIHPNKARWLFLAKTIIVPAAWIAILIWAFVAEGAGPIFEQKPTVSGSQYSWVFLASMTSVLGNYATLSVNQVHLRTSFIDGFANICTHSPISHATPASPPNGKFSTSPSSP
jgi:cytosine/uracil/thiamine/allantoin permease